MSRIYDFTLVRGDSREITFDVQTDGGSAADLTGWSVAARVSPVGVAPDVDLAASITGSTVAVVINPGVSAALPHRNTYQVELTGPGATEVRTVLSGQLTITQDIA